VDRRGSIRIRSQLISRSENTITDVLTSTLLIIKIFIIDIGDRTINFFIAFSFKARAKCRLTKFSLIEQHLRTSNKKTRYQPRTAHHKRASYA
jgi:hypothetical protein